MSIGQMSPTYTTAEIAKKVGVSRQTIQSWIAKEEIDAPKVFTVGKVRIRLWSESDLRRVRRFKGTLKPGRVPRGIQKKRDA